MQLPQPNHLNYMEKKGMLTICKLKSVIITLFILTGVLWIIVTAETVSMPKFDKGIKVGRVGRTSTHIVSSRNFIDRLYTVQNGDVSTIHTKSTEFRHFCYFK